MLSTGPNTTFKLLPWWIFGQLALDAVLFVFWLSAAATARYNCNDLCNACGWDSVSFDGLDCVCYGTDYWYEKRGMSPKQSGLLQPRRAKSSATPAGTGAAKTALDALMTYVPLLSLFYVSSAIHLTRKGVANWSISVLFFATLVGTIVYIFQHRSASSPTTHTPATGPGSHPEAGVQQVSTEMKQDIPYQPNNTNPQTQQGGYPPVSPQENYPPQGQYPPQQQGGYPPQQQYPQQGYPPQGQQQQQPMAYYGGPEVGQQPVQQQQPPMQQPPPIQQHQTAN